MENSHLVIFDEIWPKTLYYSTGSLARFLSNFKNTLGIAKYTSSNFINFLIFKQFLNLVMLIIW